MRDYLFTSESVSEGHPDKVADQISDTVLDYLLEQDPASRVACETLVNTGLVVLSGEITSNRSLDGVTERVRNTIKEIDHMWHRYHMVRSFFIFVVITQKYWNINFIKNL